MDRGAWQSKVHGVTESDMTEMTSHACKAWLYLRRISNVVLNRSSQSRYPCVPDFREKAFNLSVLSIITAVGFFLRCPLPDRGNSFLPVLCWVFLIMKWRRAWQSTAVFLPGESHGWRGLVGCMQSMGSHRVRHKWSDLAQHNHENVLDFLKCLSHFCWGSHVVFVLYSINMNLLHSLTFGCLEVLDSCNESHLILIYNYFYMLPHSVY